MRSCICGSDLHLHNGSVPDTRVGTTFGHEVCGEVVEIGAEAAGRFMQTFLGKYHFMGGTAVGGVAVALLRRKNVDLYEEAN
ncbi:MAG: alcohol dehydrogenase catalytic domain-containing protein [Pyrinomonadaceae bacterium]|nr:alcohol dehydrogenase catalytic domain-containing protein [Pyrinomonadaceae bacterium]